ncbi:hypothetical protein AMTRI_Chr09g36780 [Amborella trichopoda]
MAAGPFFLCFLLSCSLSLPWGLKGKEEVHGEVQEGHPDQVLGERMHGKQESPGSLCYELRTLSKISGKALINGVEASLGSCSNSFDEEPKHPKPWVREIWAS